MAGKQSLYEKQLERIAKAVGDDILEQMPPEVRLRGSDVLRNDYADLTS